MKNVNCEASLTRAESSLGPLASVLAKLKCKVNTHI